MDSFLLIKTKYLPLSQNGIPKITRRFLVLFGITIFLLLGAFTGPKFLMNFRLKKPSLTCYNQSDLADSNVKYHTIPMPCVEPFCHVQCSILYGTDDLDQVIVSDNMTEIQRQHLMIDMGQDEVVQKLLDFVPPPKICPRRLPSTPESPSNMTLTVQFYPIIFGFIHQFVLKTIPRTVLIKDKTVQVEQTCLPRKFKDFNELIPGDPATYRFNFENELDYRRVYSTAYFALTKKKGGWDCNRHYEIISSGSMPYFDGLREAGNHTMSHLPKSILYEAQEIAGVIRSKMTIDHKRFDLNRYNLLLHRLLYFAKRRLTTIHLAKYILDTIQYPLIASQNHTVLFISHFDSDYLKDLLLHGFTYVFETNLHVFEPPCFMYKYPTCRQWTSKETLAYFNHKLYGFGYGYKLSLKKYSHLFDRDIRSLPDQTTVKRYITEKKYSLIIFGSIARPDRNRDSLLDIAAKYYDKSRIVLIDGEDELRITRRSDYAVKGTYFLREIQDNCDAFM